MGMDTDDVLEFIVNENHSLVRNADFFELYNRGREPIGTGGFGNVYVCSRKDRIPGHTTKEYAVKSIDLTSLIANAEDFDMIDSLNREIAAMSRIKTRRAPKLQEAFVFRDPRSGQAELHLVQSLIHGEDLYDYMKERVMPLSDLQALMAQQLEVLSELHSRRIVHGDIKPKNIKAVQTQQGLDSALVDFGLARSFSEGTFGSSTFGGGTFNYMAPEQIERGIVNNATDIYSLGLVLNATIEGKEREGIVTVSNPLINFDAKYRDPRFNSEKGKRFLDTVKVMLSYNSEERMRRFGLDPGNLDEANPPKYLFDGEVISTVPVDEIGELFKDLEERRKGRNRLEGITRGDDHRPIGPWDAEWHRRVEGGNKHRARLEGITRGDDHRPIGPWDAEWHRRIEEGSKPKSYGPQLREHNPPSGRRYSTAHVPEISLDTTKEPPVAEDMFRQSQNPGYEYFVTSRTKDNGEQYVHLVLRRKADDMQIRLDSESYTGNPASVKFKLGSLGEVTYYMMAGELDGDIAEAFNLEQEVQEGIQTAIVPYVDEENAKALAKYNSGINILKQVSTLMGAFLVPIYALGNAFPSCGVFVGVGISFGSFFGLLRKIELKRRRLELNLDRFPEIKYTLGDKIEAVRRMFNKHRRAGHHYLDHHSPDAKAKRGYIPMLSDENSGMATQAFSNLLDINLDGKYDRAVWEYGFNHEDKGMVLANLERLVAHDTEFRYVAMVHDLWTRNNPVSTWNENNEKWILQTAEKYLQRYIESGGSLEKRVDEGIAKSKGIDDSEVPSYSGDARHSPVRINHKAIQEMFGYPSDNKANPNSEYDVSPKVAEALSVEAEE